MGRLQAGATLADISARKLQRAFDRTADNLDDGRKGGGKPLPYTKAIAKNNASFAVTPGSPIEITTFTMDASPEKAGRVPGYWGAAKAAKPYLVQKRIAIALEDAEPGDLFECAIDGIVRANFDNTDFPFASLLTDASGTDYQSKITSSPAMGFAMILRKLDSTSALIRFGMCQAHGTGTATSTITASSPSSSTGPTEFDISMDVYGGGTQTVKAFTFVSNIASGSKLLLIPMWGTFKALKEC